MRKVKIVCTLGPATAGIPRLVVELPDAVQRPGTFGSLPPCTDTASMSVVKLTVAPGNTLFVT